MDAKCYNLVKWEIALKSKDRGRLGIRDLTKQNNSLLADEVVVEL